MEEFKGVTNMNRMNFQLDCLDGKYDLNIDLDENNLHYEVTTNIDYLDSKSGDINSKAFKEKINKIDFNKLISVNSIKDVEIEDPVIWKFNYVIDSKDNCIEGKEGNWPYNYDELIEALILIDEKLEVFKANKK